MNIKTKKLCLELYGIFRMALGVGQIVGLFCGYFLLEWLLRYPAQSSLYVVNEEMVALICLVVLLRGIFHVVEGMGIASLKSWVRLFIIYGWPLVGIITFGLIYNLSQSWVERGLISNFSEALIWPHVFIYLGVIIFDYTLVSSFIKGVDSGLYPLTDLGERMGGKKVISFLLICLTFFLVLIFWGRPVQKGFHQGYYKMKESSTGISASPSTSMPPVSGQETVNPPKLLEAKHISLVVESNEPQKVESHPALEPLKKEDREDVPYRNVFGFLGGFLVFTGFVFQMFALKAKNPEESNIISYALLGLGFLFWVVYGLSIKQLPLSLTSGMITLLCLGILALKIRK
ncbi:MAG: hypothetical protein HQL24_06930 [Candidatus Omnitrophica bacterium]|nr:hypothetical protein [Candidatus Omnitrophota bacterium]